MNDTIISACSSQATSTEHFDVLIIGAGLSGIDAAYRLQTECPGKRYAILEGRNAIGGTWDLFKYPGVRSDSDVNTLGFPFRPWRGEKAIADGESIRRYIVDTATAFGIDRNILLGWRMVAASWSTAESRWTLDIEVGEARRPQRVTCSFLFMCSGYYNYSAGYTPPFPGIENFAGTVVHPQRWPANLQTRGKRVVVIGSGATAVTLVPALAQDAASVTMLQRSPTYIVARPAIDKIGNWINRYLPSALAGSLIRWKNILLGMAFYSFSRRAPGAAKNLILKGVTMALGKDYDVQQHFNPRYNPWDQRLCLVPDGDLFATIRAGRADVVTDTIERFYEHGIRLTSGTQLPADVVITATGLAVQMFGGAQIRVDGQALNLADRLVYKGMMFDGVPNFAIAFGYTNASWTLKCDLSARYVCRLLKHMDRTQHTVCVAQRDASVTPERLLDFDAGYVLRAAAMLPKQGSKAPWRVHQNYVLDLLSFSFSKLDDGVMQFR